MGPPRHRPPVARALGLAAVLAAIGSPPAILAKDGSRRVLDLVGGAGLADPGSVDLCSEADRRSRGSADYALEAVSRGWALSLRSVLPTVTAAVPGRILDVDLRQCRSGQWFYEVLVLSPDSRYRQVLVDAQRNQILEIRRR